MKYIYEVRLVEMDENFSTSVSDDVSGFIPTLTEAKREYKKWMSSLKKNPPEYNCYLCIERFKVWDDEPEYPEWDDQLYYKEIVNSTERV